MTIPRFSRGTAIKLGLAGLAVSLVGLGWAFGWQTPNKSSLLPRNITQQITSFTPYFYEQQVPSGYIMDQSKVVYKDQILMVPLQKANAATIVLTEQPMPPKLPDEHIQQNGEDVSVDTGKATINDIEGRLVGTLITRDRQTLILLSSVGEAGKDDIKTLLQKLVPTER